MDRTDRLLAGFMMLLLGLFGFTSGLIEFKKSRENRSEGCFVRGFNGVSIIFMLVTGLCLTAFALYALALDLTGG